MKYISHSITLCLFATAGWLCADIAPGDLTPGGAVWPDSYPSWWYDSEAPADGVVDGTLPTLNQNNDAPLLLGQLKHIASEARDEFEASLRDGAGAEIDDLVDGFTELDSGNYSPANIGQLKAVSSVFFNRLAAVDFTSASAGWPDLIVLDEGEGDNAINYPWHDNVTADNAAIANIGQAKHLFSWDFSKEAPVLTVDHAMVSVDAGGQATNTGTYTDIGGGELSFIGSIGTVQDNFNGSWAWSFDSTVGVDASQTVTIFATDTDGNLATIDFSLIVTVDEELDSDGDGMPDWWEEQYGLASDSANDVAGNSDGDQLINLHEYYLGTDPTVDDDEDSDGDGIPDSVENQEEYTFLDPDVLTDAFADEDGDRYPNIFELYCGTDPVDPSSKPEFGDFAYFLVDETLTENSGNSFTNIVDAENAADDYNYAIIEVLPGNYEGKFHASTTPMMLLSRDGAITTAIRGVTSDEAFYASVSVALDGFTLSDSEQGIYLNLSSSNGEQALIRNCIIRDNGWTDSASYGGGICVSGGTVLVSNCVIENNFSSSAGGGVYLTNADAVFTDTQILNNRTVYSGGGVHLSGSASSVSITKSMISRNTTLSTSSDGGGIYLSGAELIIDKASIMGNRSGDDGGAIYQTGGALTLTASAIMENASGDEGGAVYVNSGDQTVIHSTIANNSNPGSYDIYFRYSGYQYEYINTIISNSKAVYLANGGLDETTVFSNCLTVDTAGNLLVDFSPLVPASTDPLLTREGHLQAGSPAINQAVISSVAVDMDGEPYPSAGRDLGADEFIDFDGDQLPDWFGVSDPTGNADFDGGNGDSLTNLEEYIAGTNPLDSDTDDDSLLDDDELSDQTSTGDTDGHITDPLNPDDDFDGMPTAWEIEYYDDSKGSDGGGADFLKYFLDDADYDYDFDGITNIEEYLGGTHPYDGPLGNPDGDNSNNRLEQDQGTDPWDGSDDVNNKSIITLIAPSENVISLEGASLDLKATASDEDAFTPIDRVEFYTTHGVAPNEVVTQVKTIYSSFAVGDLYSGTWYNLPVLNDVDTVYTLKAVVVDNYGHRVESSMARTITVLVDSDHDQLYDTWETENFGNLDETWNGDADGDGATNLYEYHNGTDAIDPDSTPVNNLLAITLDAPLDGTTITEGDSVYLAATATDEDIETPIDRVEFHRESSVMLVSMNTPEVVTAYAATWSDSLALYSLNDSAVSFYARVLDVNDVELHNLPLTGEYSLDYDGKLNYSSLELAVEVPGDGSSIDRVEFYHSKESIDTLIATFTPTVAVTRYAWTWADPLIFDSINDSYSLTALALDASGAALSIPVEVISQYSLDEDGYENTNSLDLIVLLGLTEAAAVDSIEIYCEKRELIATIFTPTTVDLYTWTWRDTGLQGAGTVDYGITATVFDVYGHTVTSNVATLTIQGDADGDGMLDIDEQTIIDANAILDESASNKLLGRNEDGLIDIYDVLAEDDFDGDGASNFYEFMEGTDPTDATDFPSNYAPSVVNLVSPVEGEEAIEGATLSLVATGSNVDSTIQKVEFYIDGLLFETDYVPLSNEYRADWPSLSVSAGVDTDYTVQAKAIDEYYNVVMSDLVTITVLADVDGDQIGDSFEETIIQAHLEDVGVDLYADLVDQNEDSLIDIYDVLPFDDFDQDGANNYFEFLNRKNPRVNTPSIISLIEPSEDLTLWQGESLVLSALASDADGVSEIERVEFFYEGTQGRTLIGSNVGSLGDDRYFFNWQSLPVENNAVSTYTLSATVYDIYGHQQSIASALTLFVRSDIDGDRMQDSWEQGIVDAHLADVGADLFGDLVDQNDDGVIDVYDVRKEDDFDGDGASNFFEFSSIPSTSPIDGAVKPVATILEISLTEPLDGSIMWEGESLKLSATVTAIDMEPVDRVVFMMNGIELGSDFSPIANTYSFNWSNAEVDEGSGAASYQLSATAFDIYGNSLVSSAVTVTIREDADGDRMQDDWERIYFNGNIDQLPDGDYDGDGAANRLEHNLETNPNDSGDVPEDAAAVISMSAPTGGTVAWEGGALLFAAVATDADTEIVRVEFYEGTNLLGSDSVASTNGTYSYVWSNLPAQSSSLTAYSITAKVVDAYGQIVTSSAVTVYVQGDSDQDGLPDDWEQSIIDAGLTDQDGDLDVDVFDVLAGDDFDSDNVTNMEEYLLGFSPVDSDSEDSDSSDDDNDDGVTDDLEDRDGDLMPDVWELRYEKWVNFEEFDSGKDPDGDSIINSLEYQYDLHPGVFNENAVDIDEDGLLDSWEQLIIAAGLTDQDGDGDVDLNDVLRGDDFDNDGILNEDEYKNGTDPTDPTNGANDDPDGDGLGSEFERLQRTDPLGRDNPTVNLKLILPANE